MTVTLELPDELAISLQNDADQYGVPLAEYIARSLGEKFGNFARPKTGAELVTQLHAKGLIGTRPDIQDSQAYARELREKAQTR